MASRWLTLLLALVAALPAALLAQTLQGEVLSIGDGDTIRVRQAGRAVTVRMACIDAPETAQSPWGQQARRYLQQRLPIGREVILEVKTTDRYGRTVAEVISDINISLAMVEDGQAFAYRQYLSGCDAKEYLDAEFRASRRRYGVWQVEGGITRPWDFRRGREIGSYARAQELLRQGHTYLDGNSDREACESLRELVFRAGVREQVPQQATAAGKETYLEVEGRPGSQPDPHPPGESGQGSPEPVRATEVRPTCEAAIVNLMAQRERHPVAAETHTPALFPAC